MEVLNKPEDALDFYRRSLACAEQDCVQKAYTLAQMGLFYNRLVNKPEAIKCTEDALRVFRTTNDKTSITACEQQLAEIQNAL